MTAPTASTAPTAPTASSAVTGPHADDVPGDWLAVHVFYAASPRPLLLQCVKPLVDDLTEEGLLAGYFFINYWLEGPHLRLRLRPRRAADAPVVRERAHAALAAFLRERPALYEVKAGFLAELYETLFTLEYTEDQRAEFLGPDGRMRLRPNNSFEDRPYEPEYGKYGGPGGVALAEWHFQHSSDLVVEAARGMNLHLRTVLLGLSAQLMMVMSGTFLKDDEALLAFLDRYHAFWDRAFNGTNYTTAQGYDRAYTEMGASLPERFRRIRDAVAQGGQDRLPAFLRGWAEHCTELRDRAAELTLRGELTFRAWDGSRDIRPTDPAHALPMLLSPYLHMTNNRLSMTIRDEAFLSYVLARALRDETAGKPNPAGAPAEGSADGTAAGDTPTGGRVPGGEG
ncbi:lantibiotic dehydratase C-terminal domain-containing protein [Streptomyces sp. RPA4-2]|uniref:lantibiotic dehydratase C-terminal domain-containing protein n=1 Tax=Streptomyces sp. RPA4-2 TaxID=2721244 RepID=UPI00143E9FA8|nr:lantibiotic dehydratase C-terminal domain-containing protein [Streptomyces sp. RPA4-2]QIY61202.1 lantibiotic biosynthesis protein [Streptomyces sp. RPA4-2]